MERPTPKDALTELKRELGMRRHKYPQWVQAGSLKQKDADLRIARLEAAMEIVEKAAEEADRAGRLL